MPLYADVFSDRPEAMGWLRKKGTHVNQRSTRQGAPVFPVVFNT